MAGVIITGGGNESGIGLVDNVQPRNVGTVDAFRFTEREQASGRGLNDSIQTAELLPLGTGPGRQNTVDVSGFLAPQQFGGTFAGTLPEDVDFFAMDLRAGDILDIAGLGSIGRFDVLYSNGAQWFGTLQNQGGLGVYPASSPLMTVGNAVGAQIVPQDGRYFVRIATNGLGASAYTLGLRVYRPVLEREPVGTQQILFLDFDGGIFPASIFGVGAAPGDTIIIPSLVESLNNLGFVIPLDPTPEAEAVTNFLIDDVLRRVNEDFNLFVPQFGGNGNYNATGIAGQFGIRILNSRDHADPGFFAPHVTRVFVGGSGADVLVPGGGLYGISESVDVGNFDTSEIVFTVLDAIGQDAQDIDISLTASRIQIAAQGIALTISHEAAHSFGLFHTDRAGGIPSIIDANVDLVDDYELGPDEIFGTPDDINIPFPNRDRFNPVEGYLGFQRVAANLAWGLATGTAGTAVTGTVFTDLNRDGRLTTGEGGLAGATVFVDTDRDGQRDPGEISTISGSNGAFSLSLGPGTYQITAIAPPSFAPAVTTQTITVAANGASNVNLGFSRVSSDITGTKWADLNGNGVRDAGEPGIAGVLIYLDLDGDDRIDLGEPRAMTDANGNYTLTFPGPGTYTIREVVGPGFQQTFPANGEHVVVFNGTSLGNNFNFGNLPTLDFADAPDSYLTLVSSGGPSHGILPGLSLGRTPDRELDGSPSVNADGDDAAGAIGADGVVIDDEDGVRILTPIGPGANATFEVNLTNTTGQTGFLQAWFDFNRNGRFDSNEKVIVDATRAPGINTFSIPVPATVTPGPLYTRWRYSLTPGLGVGGPADTGEVEDHVFTVQQTAAVANNDNVTVTRNSQVNVIDVLANDFETPTNPLRITSIDRVGPGTRGTVSIAAGGRSILYTPPIGFTGRDTFTYTVTPAVGPSATATVNVNVSFLSDVPIAVDDTFEVAEGSTNIALNVLDNDVPSRLGGVSIISVTPGSQGGTTSLAGGSQSVRYTPRPGFNGTEEFAYSISDSQGNVSSAKATINLMPGSRNDDLVAFSVGFFDVTNNTPITNIQVGDEFLVRVSVEDLRTPLFENRGVFSAFIDLLYTDELASVVPDANNAPFNFDIVFGNQFQSAFDLETGDADVPGLLNEIGSQRPLGVLPTQPEGPIELFTVRMQAVSPGIAVFQTNPADVAVNETTLFNSQTAVTVPQQRLGFGEITISPSGTSFTSAIDDSFPIGVDSLGQQIRGGVPATLDVTRNDILGPTGVIDQFALVTQPGLGVATIGPNNTIIYTPDASANGFDSFRYTIVTADGVRSTAEVTLTVGNAAANDLMEIALRVVDGAGNPINGPISVGSRFGVQVIVDDLRSPLAANPLGVFGAFADILYNAGLVTPSNTMTGDLFDFDVVFGPEFGVVGAFGTARLPGVIDEFGSFLTNSNPNNDPPNPALTGEPVLLATLFFNATASGTAQFTAGPADSLPFRESLLFQPPDPVPVSQIRYGVSSVTIGGANGEGPVARQNAVNPADVNDDGKVSPLDALTVINELSRVNRGEGEAARQASLRFTDVSGDGKITPLDALQVINAISRRNRLAPNEVAAPAPEVVKVTTYRDLQAIRNRLAGDFTVSSTTPPVFAPTTAAEGFGSDDSDDEDVFDLLARDISGIWK